MTYAIESNAILFMNLLMRLRNRYEHLSQLRNYNQSLVNNVFQQTECRKVLRVVRC